jgi:putrescine transport system substrate-binding protein
LGLYLPLDKSKIPNYKNLDKNILKILERDDPGNKYTVPWMMSATGIGYDIDKIKEIDPNAPVDSLEIIFNPVYAKKFAQCGIFWFNFGQEMIGLALLYLGKDPNDTDPHNLALAVETIRSVKKYVRAISNTAYIDFENSDMCLTVGWSAEIAQHLEKLKFSKELSKKRFAISLPKDGFFVEIDTMAVPSNAKNVDNAYEFINYLLEPSVAAYNSNKYKHMNANKASYHLLDKDITENKAINIPEGTLQKNGKTLSAKSKEFVRTRSRTWAFIVSE